MFGARYLKFCKEASDCIKIVEAWSQLKPEQRWGCLIAWRSFLGMIIPCRKRIESVIIIAETEAISTWCNLEEDIRVIKNYYHDKSNIPDEVGFGNIGFPVFTLRQLMALYPLVGGEMIYTNLDVELCPEVYEKLCAQVLVQLIAAARS